MVSSLPFRKHRLVLAAQSRAYLPPSFLKISPTASAGFTSLRIRQILELSLSCSQNFASYFAFAISPENLTSPSFLAVILSFMALAAATVFSRMRLFASSGLTLTSGLMGPEALLDWSSDPPGRAQERESSRLGPEPASLRPGPALASLRPELESGQC